jgi:hypothetical protein
MYGFTLRRTGPWAAGSYLAVLPRVGEGRVIAWRPKTAASRAPAPTEHRWTMAKQEWRITCVVEQSGRLGWAIRVLMNGEWLFRCEFPTWTAAVNAADTKYAELMGAGWTAAPSPNKPAG